MLLLLLLPRPLHPDRLEHGRGWDVAHVLIPREEDAKNRRHLHPRPGHQHPSMEDLGIFGPGKVEANEAFGREPAIGDGEDGGCSVGW